jgi:hypothetical protein
MLSLDRLWECLRRGAAIFQANRRGGEGLLASEVVENTLTYFMATNAGIQSL